LNFGPDAEGRIPREQWDILNEISLWYFINREALEHTVPHYVIREGNIWFLRHKSEPTVYAFITEDSWNLGERKSFLLKSTGTSDRSTISLLGHNGKVLEYNPTVDSAPTVTSESDGTKISVMRAQRIYNDRDWPNPIVVKIEMYPLIDKCGPFGC